MLPFHMNHKTCKKLTLLEAQLQLDVRIKQSISTGSIKVEKGNACINDMVNSLRNDPQILRWTFDFLSNHICPRIQEIQRADKLLQEAEEQLKFKRQKIKEENSQSIKEQQKIQLSTQQIKETIKKIEQAIRQSIQSEKQKRELIQVQTELSLKQIQNKITSFEKESILLEKQNISLRKNKKQIEDKLGRLETQFSRKALQKDESVKKEKEQLILKLQQLEGQVSEVTDLNKEYSTKQKINFDKKLSLYLKAKKFPEYCNSFQNSAKTIDQCKEQLLKGIQRMNEASDTIARFEIEAKDLCDQFTSEFKRRDEREARIERLKKQKEFMRDRIITIQNKIKSLKINLDENC